MTDLARSFGRDLDLDLVVLRRWFVEHVPGAQDAPLRAWPCAGVRSSLSFTVTDGCTDWILRRPRTRRIFPNPNDMEREFRVLSALVETEVPVPRPLASCPDPSLIGVPFYVMEKLDGLVARTESDLSSLDAASARRCSEGLVDLLASIHAVDLAATGLQDLGPPGDPFLGVRESAERWLELPSLEVTAIRELARRLAAAAPTARPVTLVHGDYRLDNLMLDRSDPGRIVAVLDWEVVALGDPLSDLGYLLAYWDGLEPELGAVSPVVSPDAGFLGRDHLVDRYAQRSGRDLTYLELYEALALYRLAQFVATIWSQAVERSRTVWGLAVGPDLVERLAERALDRAGRSSIPALRGAAGS